MTPDQRNEIVVELMKGLEVGEYEFSKYIPQYLGQAALWLPPEQLEEIVSYLHGMMANANDQIVSVALDTVGVLLERYSCYPERFAEEKRYARNGADGLLGILLSGPANYRESVRQEAMLVLGQTVFGSSWMECREKKRAVRPVLPQDAVLIQ